MRNVDLASFGSDGNLGIELQLGELVLLGPNDVFGFDFFEIEIQKMVDERSCNVNLKMRIYNLKKSAGSWKRDESAERVFYRRR